MHVVWKRPDGFHGAEPKDFRVVTLGGNTRFWLHKTDREWFPFRVSGGWQESEATKKLNNLINLIGEPEQAWADCLIKLYNDTMSDDPAKFFAETHAWLGELRSHLKGDTWEMDIMNQALEEVQSRLDDVRELFLARTAS